jgi:putative redox protein
MELMLMSVGSCSSVDVVHILKKGRHPVSGCEVRINGERAETDPKVFTRIHLHFIVSGPGLAEAAVRRAVQLSAEKYCSASIMLQKAAEITHDFEIVETSPG